MVDAQAAYAAIGDQAQNHAVAVVENLRLLDAQADEAVDGEETPVVELFLRTAPVGESVVLALQDRVERVGVSIYLVELETVQAFGR